MTSDTDYFSAIVESVWQVTARVRGFRLRDPEGRKLPPFSAGAHIELSVPGGLKRYYSLINDPKDLANYTIAIQRTSHSSGIEDSYYSRIKVGALLNLSFPRNNLRLDNRARRHAFIAGGIGITPFLSMLPVLQRKNCQFEIHMCARNENDIPFQERLLQSGGKINFYYSQAESCRRLVVSDLLQTIPADHQIYCCGPMRLICAVRSAAKIRKDPQSVHFDICT